MPFAHSGFINTGVFQFLVIAGCGLFLLPAIAPIFLLDWNFMDAFQDAFYEGWWWLFSLLFWIGLLWYLNTKLVSKWWNETNRMNPDNKQASIAEIFIVCVIGIVWFLLNRVDSWFYSMNTDYLRRVLATYPVAVCIQEGNPSIYYQTLGETKIIKTLKTFTNCGSIWDYAVRDELLEAHLQNVQYVVRHVENAKGFTRSDYIYALLSGDDAKLTKTNEWLHEHHARIGGGDEDYHPHEYVDHMLDHEHDISECSFTMRSCGMR